MSPFGFRVSISAPTRLLFSETPNRPDEVAADSPPQRHRIFCYGDSLTAGTSPPSMGEFPYGTHLERALGIIDDGPSSAAVRWLGLPGWTATSLRDSLDAPNGLRTLLRRIHDSAGEPASLAVILAGTNDLAYEVESGPIIEALSDLHKAAHGEGVRTMAVSIPSSGWQSVDDRARSMATEVNDALRRMCSKSGDGGLGGMATFAEFPILGYEPGSGLWAPDGLHFSPEGYSCIGLGLAEDVASALKCGVETKKE